MDLLGLANYQTQCRFKVLHGRLATRLFPRIGRDGRGDQVCQFTEIGTTTPTVQSGIRIPSKVLTKSIPIWANLSKRLSANTGGQIGLVSKALARSRNTSDAWRSRRGISTEIWNQNHQVSDRISCVNQFTTLTDAIGNLQHFVINHVRQLESLQNQIQGTLYHDAVDIDRDRGV